MNSLPFGLKQKPINKGMIKTREQLDYLLTIKEFPIRINKDMEIVPI